MTVEADVQAWQQNYAPLANLVGAIAQNAVPQDAPLPYVAWVITTTPDYGLAGNVQAMGRLTTHECWASDAAEADAVADQVQAAMGAQGIVCTSRATAYEPDLDLHATVLTFEWWD